MIEIIVIKNVIRKYRGENVVRRIIARENVIGESVMEKMLLEKFVISEGGFSEFCFKEICRYRKCFRESVAQSKHLACSCAFFPVHLAVFTTKHFCTHSVCLVCL